MDGDRTRYGTMGAVLGALGGYFLAWRRGRRDRRELALRRLAQRGAEDSQQQFMEARLQAIDKDKRS